MLKVKGQVVICDHGSVQELLQDTQNVIATFVSISKKKDMPDELIEKALITMIDIAFRHQSDIYGQQVNSEVLKDLGLDEIIKRFFKDE